jgi:hypothetical protein
MKKNKYPVNEKSFFATSESVGCYWRSIKRGRQIYKAAKGTGALQKKNSTGDRIVIIPPGAILH